jgi:hypothetical protein
MVVILGSPNEPEKNEGNDENEGQTEADEVAGGHNGVVSCCFAELSGIGLPFTGSRKTKAPSPRMA